MLAKGSTNSTSGYSRPHRRFATGALALALAFGAVACGDDDEQASDEPKSEFATYCERAFAIENYFAGDPEVDFETATEAEVQAAVAQYLQGAKPLIDAALPVIPAEIKESIGVQVAAFNEALAGRGNPEEIFETPEVQAAEAKTHAFDLKNCGWGNTEVSTVDYSFQGLPTELKAGRRSIDLTNKGKELHEIIFLSKNPGVTESFDQILALPREQAQTKVTDVFGAFAAQGETEYAVGDIPKGQYLAVCFIPQGLTSEETPPAPDAKPHFLLGMKQEVTVS